MPMKDLQHFEKIAEQVIRSFGGKRDAKIKFSQTAVDAFTEALATVRAEIKKRQKAGAPVKKPGDTKAAKKAARMKQYRTTGSTVGHEALLTQ